MKKSGWIILTLFSIFFINALVKEKEFLAPDDSVSTHSLQHEESSAIEFISTLSLEGYTKVCLYEGSNCISGKANL